MMKESDPNTALFSNWKTIIPLLRTVESAESLKVCCNAVLELIVVSELPDLFHLLIFSEYVFHNEKNAQKNCLYFLSELCYRYQKELVPLLEFSHSDGDFLKFASFDFDTLLKNRNSNLLFKSKKAASESPNTTNADRDLVYQKVWYEKQRLRLEKLFKTTVSSADASLAMNYANTMDFVTPDDVVKIGPKEENPIDFKDSPADQYHSETKLTQETWFARLFRYLIVNLLNEDWEIRCNCSFAIDAILKGLHKSSSPDAIYQGQFNNLPIFLLEDILCIGISVLVLDQFIDFDQENGENIVERLDDLSFPSADSQGNEKINIFPVKESVSETLLNSFTILMNHYGFSIQLHPEVSTQLMDTNYSQKLFEIFVNMCICGQTSFPVNWVLLISGLVGLEKFIIQFPAIIFQLNEQQENCNLERILEIIHFSSFLLTGDYHEISVFSFLLFSSLVKQLRNNKEALWLHPCNIAIIRKYLNLFQDHYRSSSTQKMEVNCSEGNNKTAVEINVLFLLKVSLFIEILVFKPENTDLTVHVLTLFRLLTNYFSLVNQNLLNWVDLIYLFNLNTLHEITRLNQSFLDLVHTVNELPCITDCCQESWKLLLLLIFQYLSCSDQFNFERLLQPAESDTKESGGGNTNNSGQSVHSEAKRSVTVILSENYQVMKLKEKFRSNYYSCTNSLTSLILALLRKYISTGFLQDSIRGELETHKITSNLWLVTVSTVSFSDAHSKALLSSSLQENQPIQFVVSSQSYQNMFQQIQVYYEQLQLNAMKGKDQLRDKFVIALIQTVHHHSGFDIKYLENTLSILLFNRMRKEINMLLHPEIVKTEQIQDVASQPPPAKKRRFVLVSTATNSAVVKHPTDIVHKTNELLVPIILKKQIDGKIVSLLLLKLLLRTIQIPQELFDLLNALSLSAGLSSEELSLFRELSSTISLDLTFERSVLVIQSAITLFQNESLDYHDYFGLLDMFLSNLSFCIDDNPSCLLEIGKIVSYYFWYVFFLLRILDYSYMNL
jgi:hypothetical protein